VVGAGQVQPRKRLDSFVAAAKALPRVSFVWVGGIPFKGLAAESGSMDRLMHVHPKNVKFSGLIQRSEVVDYYRAADLFFLPSEQETFGLVVVEAAAAGLPVLLRDIAQYRDTFGGGYEKGTDVDFATLIERFSKDKVYYEKWRKASEQIALRYSSEAGAMRLMEVYAAVLADK
jgi:1,2-diacylglycerol-3-alpha-glucose alpha-1,2-galactosyltransferase